MWCYTLIPALGSKGQVNELEASLVCTGSLTLARVSKTKQQKKKPNKTT